MRKITKTIMSVAACLMLGKCAYDVVPLPGYPPGDEIDLGPVRLAIPPSLNWSFRGPRIVGGGGITLVLHWPDMAKGNLSTDVDNHILVFLDYHNWAGWGTTGQYGGPEAEANMTRARIYHHPDFVLNPLGIGTLYKEHGHYKYYKHGFREVFVIYDDGRTHIFADCSDGLVMQKELPLEDQDKVWAVPHPACRLDDRIWNDHYPQASDGSTPFKLWIEIPVHHIEEMNLIDEKLREYVDSKVVKFGLMNSDD